MFVGTDFEKACLVIRLIWLNTGFGVETLYASTKLHIQHNNSCLLRKSDRLQLFKTKLASCGLEFVLISYGGVDTICYLVQRFCKTDHKMTHFLHNPICKMSLVGQTATENTTEHKYRKSDMLTSKSYEK